MSDTTLAFILTVALLAGLALWVPLLDSIAALASSAIRRPEEMPNLVEDDTSPQLTGEVA